MWGLWLSRHSRTEESLHRHTCLTSGATYGLRDTDRLSLWLTTMLSLEGLLFVPASSSGASNAVGASVSLVKSSVTLTQTSEGGLTCAHRATHRFSFSLEDEAFQSSSSFVKGEAKAALYCAHRTSTVSPCAFCEQEGHLPLPPHPSEGARSRNIRRSAASSFPPASYPNPLSCFKSSLVDPRLRASNEVTDDPSKLARSLFRDGG